MALDETGLIRLDPYPHYAHFCLECDQLVDYAERHSKETCEDMRTDPDGMCFHPPTNYPCGHNAPNRPKHPEANLF